MKFTPAQVSVCVPNPHYPGQWYPVNIEGIRPDLEVCKTNGKGRNAGKSFIKARFPIWVNLVSCTGEILEKHVRRDYEVFIGRGETWERIQ